MKILFEDNAVVVIDKPSGITVNRSETTKDVTTVQDWIEQNFKISEIIVDPHSVDTQGSLDEPEVFGKRSGIVHRIDKETSGILIVAKQPVAFFSLLRQFRERTVEKSYIAMVHGEVLPRTGEIHAPVGRQEWNRKRFGVIPGGRDATTGYTTGGQYRWKSGGAETLTLLSLFPKTGRTHQIRVHMKYINHPIVSDELYGGRKTARSDRKKLARLFLHAATIRFTHPNSGEAVKIKSDLPEDLLNFMMHYLQKVELMLDLR